MVSADVSEPRVGEVLHRAMDEVGKQVDVLVNCAGITHTAPMIDTPSEKYQVLILQQFLQSCYCFCISRNYCM